MKTRASILVVDDDASLAKVLVALLAQSGFETAAAASGEEALKLLEARPFDLVISDVRMPGMGGMTLLTQASARWPDLPVVMLTAHGTVALAVEAMKAGAADFVLKPFDRDELLYCIQKSLAASSRHADEVPRPASPSSDFIGDSEAIREVRALVDRVGPGNSTVLLLGESGTGKEVVARAIHQASPRRAKALVKLNCGALPDNLLESELFGYEKGAFTGASARKPGRVELADGGTLFLDEIGDISPQMQVKLLRVLQEREFERLGSTVTLKVDVRFIAATNRNLAELVAKGEYREDLYYRLNVVPLNLPPLRARPTDIQPLARHFAQMHTRNDGRPIELSPGALERLAAAPWPGNVRQLQNLIERLAVLSPGPTISAADVDRELARSGIPSIPVVSTSAPAGAAPASPSSAGSETLGAAVENTEREAIRDALTRANGNRTLAARLLGVSRRALYYKLNEYQIG